MSVCADFVSPRPGAGLVLYELAVGLPAVAFLAFLAWQLQPCLHKLQRSGSSIMAVYYGLLWGVTGLNLVRCILQIVAAGLGHHTVAWDVLWLLTRAGMLSLEAAAVVYLLQGRASSGKEALATTAIVSGAAAALDAAVKALLLWAAHVPLFTADPVDDARWPKWGFWLLHSLAGAACYSAVAALPCTRWRSRLPAKPAFRRYVVALLAAYAALSLGALLIGARVAAGYCVYGLASWAYFAAFPAAVYATFLAEFFGQARDLDLALYSEMRDAGMLHDDEGGGGLDSSLGDALLG